MVQGRDDLTPAGPMTILGKVYGPLISKLESDNNEKVAVVHSEGDVREGPPRKAYFFCYDWRRDPGENAELLQGVLSAVKASSPGGGAAAVIGHSMGAQIAWSVVNGEPELASSLLLAGGPFGGNWSFMRDMVRGGGTMLYRQPPAVLFTYPAPFCFLPLEKDTSESLAKGSEGNWDPKRAESWADHGILLSPSDPDFEEKKGHLQNCLDRALAFRATLRELKHDKSAYPPVTVVAGGGTKTSPLFGISKDENGMLGPNFDHDDSSEGDGRFLVSETRPPVDLDIQVYITGKKHNALLADTNLIFKAMEDLKKMREGVEVGDVSVGMEGEGKGLAIEAIDVDIGAV